MKKRFVTTLFAFIACIACLLGFAACGDTDPVSVAGKTFVFEKIEFPENMSDEQKEMLNQAYKDTYMEFTDDGKAVLGKIGDHPWVTMFYEQNGNELTITDSTCYMSLPAMISGDTFSIAEESGAVLTYKLSANENAGGKDDGDDENDGNVLKDKTYILNHVSIVPEPDGNYLINAPTQIAFQQNNECTVTQQDFSFVCTYTINDNKVTITLNGVHDLLSLVIEENTLKSTMTSSESTITIIYTLQ